jgi:hypothetical protein
VPALLLAYARLIWGNLHFIHAAALRFVMAVTMLIAYETEKMIVPFAESQRQKMMIGRRK